MILAIGVALIGERRADNIPLFDVSHSNAMLYLLKATCVRREWPEAEG